MRKGKQHVLLMSASAFAMAAFALTPNLAHAQCVTVGTTLTCAGDLSDGVNSSTADLDTLIINLLTTDIGRRGVDFRNTGGLDITFEVILNDPYSIVLMPPTNGSIRNGFNIQTDGSITGTLTGDVTGPTLEGGDLAAFDDDTIQNYGAIGLDAQTGVSLQHDGDVNVSREDIAAYYSVFDRVDLTVGRFAAIRAETDTGDVDIVNNGDIILDGGSRTAVNDSRFMNPAGTATIRFTNALSENLGLFAQGNDDLTIRQTGDITITRGDAIAFSRTEGNIADAQAQASRTTGIYVPRFTQSGGTSVGDLPVFTNINIEMTGDITITGGETYAEAIAFNLSAAGTGQEAVAEASRSFSSASGVSISNGESIVYSHIGNVSVTGGTGTANAFAVGTAINDADGPVHSSARGQSATGYYVSPAFSFNGPRPDITRVDLTINGNTMAVGGDSVAVATGTDRATRNQLATDLPEFQATEALESSGGSATGVSAFAEDLSLDVNGTIEVTGGDASGEMNGSDINGDITGGSATGLSFSNRNRLNYTHVSQMTATGGDATAVLNGDGMTVDVAGGSATGINLSLSNNTSSSYTQRGGINVTGGEASVTARSDSTVEVDGGSATGLFAGLLNGSAIGDGGRAVVRNEADIVVRGGDATRDNGSSTDLSSGGSAIGFQVWVGGAIAPLVQHAGTIRATAGTGPDGEGAVLGMWVTDFGFSSLDADFNPIGNDVLLEVTGDITVSGVGSGVNVGVTGHAEVLLDGAAINAAGSGAAGVLLASGQTTIDVINGTTIRSTDADGSGILINSAYDYYLTTPIFSTISAINVADGTSVVADQGIAIRDEDTGAPNETTVNIAGTLTGGSGTAIDLGSGSDTATFQQTAIINGNTLLGSGDDIFIYQGFTETNPVDGGDDRDRIAVTAVTGTNNSFDPTVNIPNFTNFEAIAKDGDGTLTVTGTPYTGGMLDFEVNEGLGMVDTDQPNINIIVASGATFRTDNEVGDMSNLAGGRVEGTGTAADFANNGVFAPGNSIGTFAVAGNLVLGSSGTLEVEIEAPDQADLVIVGGTTTLDGTLSVVGISSAFADGQTYTVIDSAGAVSGSFAAVTDDLPDFDVVPIIVDGGDGGEEVELALTTGNSDSDSGLSDKAIVPNAQQAQIKTGRLFSAGLGSRTDDRRSAQTAVMDDGTVNSFAAGRTVLGYGAPAVAEPNQTLGGLAIRPVRTAWVAGLGGYAQVNTSATASGYNADAYGLAGGMDMNGRTGSFDWLLGAALGYTASNVRSASSSADVSTGHLGIYGRIDKGAARLSARMSYGFQDYDFNRLIPVGTTTSTATGDADGHLFVGSVTGAYDIAPQLGLGQTHALRLAPAATLGYVYSYRGAFTETGAGIFNQSYTSDDFGYGFLRLGVEIGATTTFANGLVLRPRGGLHWEWHLGASNTTAVSTASAVAGSAFSSPGAVETDGSLVTEAGFDLDFNSAVSMHFTYEGAFAGDSNQHRLVSGLKVRF